MSSATIRPNGAAGVGAGVTLTGGASVNAVTSDNSDAGYATVPSPYSFAVDLGTSTIPAGGILKSATLRARHRGPITTARLRIGSAGAILISTSFADQASFTTITGPTYAPTAATLQADIDALQVLVGATGVGFDISEIYVDLVFAEIPVTAVSAPTGSITATSQPPVVWTHTPGADGGAQTRYRVKIFTAAQYGIGGFDPETSPNTYDSGELLGTATTLTPDALPTGITWRAYVKTAQDVNGQPHWAAWAFSGFSTSYTVPTISTIVDTPDNTNARHAIAIARVVAAPTWTAYDVERSIDGGTVWVPVRGQTNQAPPSDSFTVYDYEVGNTVTALYRARGKTSVFTGAWLASTPAKSWTSTSSFLKDVDNPTLNKTVRARLLPSPVRPRRSGVFEVLGRSDPVVLSDVLTTRRGSIEFTTTTEQEALDLLALCETQVLLFQTPTSHRVGSIYLVFHNGLIEGRTNRVAQAPHRYFSADFVEVVAPEET